VVIKFIGVDHWNVTVLDVCIETTQRIRRVLSGGREKNVGASL
jgi:hypothetical protein